jgi:hypothetical protein
MAIDKHPAGNSVIGRDLGWSKRSLASSGLIVTRTCTGSRDQARLLQPQDPAIQHRYVTKNRQQSPNPRHNHKIPKKKMPKSTRAFLQPDSSSHREMSRDDVKRRKTRHSTQTSMAPASQRTNETTKIIPEGSPPNLGSGISRYHWRSSVSRNEAKQQPVQQDHSSCEGEKSDDEEASFDIMGGQRNISTSPLCHHCQYMFDNWSKWIDDVDFRYPHYENKIQLEDSAKNGCSLCYQFCRNNFEGRFAWRRKGGGVGVGVARRIYLSVARMG